MIIPENEISRYLEPRLIWKYKVVPYEVEEGVLTVLATGESVSEATHKELSLITGCEIRVKARSLEELNILVSKYSRINKAPALNFQAEQDRSDDMLPRIISEAKALGCSDIHIETYADKNRIRFRVDGKLIERYSIPKDVYPGLINKIKIMARLDIAEKRLPQDGRILVNTDSKKFDIRVSIMPSLYGEKVVLRLLNDDVSHVKIDSLGFDDRQLTDFMRTLKKPHGIMLISGPTGSGKTTTLYATLKILNSEHSNILTIEDPIEYTLDGINQVQLKESIGLTFAGALRSFLRQDPDIIMLGEIRDAETAQMAIRAALTGHLVLSTIHTNSAWGTISRLTDMGVPSFLVANTLTMTIAQRLVRRLCGSCKKDSNPIPVEGLPAFKSNYVPVGCSKCFYTGYSGRIAIYEMIPIDGVFSQFIKDGVQNVDSYIKENGITTLRERAIDLVNGGVTSFEEVYPILINN